jgi:hypothetical protein
MSTRNKAVSGYGYFRLVGHPEIEGISVRSGVQTGRSGFMPAQITRVNHNCHPDEFVASFMDGRLKGQDDSVD